MRDDEPGPLLLVDAASLYFRAFYGVPESVTAPDGMPVNAVRGFLDMVATLLDRRRPSRFVACLDLDWRPAFRVALVPSYKAHRVAPDGGEAVPDLLSPQVPVLLQVLDALGLRTAGAAGFEADDVIATLATRADAAGARVDIVSGDRDLIALATERVTVCYVGRGVSKLEALGPAEVQAKYGVPPQRYPDMAVLRGDPSDGLPGVPGIGEKTAAALVQRFGSVEQIVQAVRRSDDRMPTGALGKLRAALDYLAVAPDAVRGRTDVPLPEHDDRLPATPAHPDRVVELADRYGLDSSVNRVLNAVGRCVA